MADKGLIVGVLALQGAVEEHISSLQRLGCQTREIRKPVDLEGLDGIICPGGESTAMAIIGEKCGLFQALKKWVQDSNPIWGTCAGMILLSDHALKQAVGGQSLVGGLDVHVCRNYFGSQIFSCEYEIVSEHKLFEGSKGIFIRAPAIVQAGPGVEIIGTVVAPPHSSAVKAIRSVVDGSGSNDDQASGYSAKQSVGAYDSGALSYEVAVAVQQDNILATAFHPELTDDLRWHRYFLDLVREHRNKRII